jgi:hypothetical protein
MRRICTLLAVLLLAACAAQEEAESGGMEQAIRDYIEVRKPPELDSIRSSNQDHWTELDTKFIIYSGRHDAFLVEFSSNCYALQERPVVADVRREPNRVRARFDTIRGCRIHKIYALTENDVAELSALGTPVDSGN